MTIAHRGAALEAKGLSKRYKGGVLALSDLSLGIPRGSITALVGPNAAGKSSLIKTWVAFERPTAGSVLVMGTDPWRNRSEALSHLGYVPQQPALYRALTVAAHLDVAARVRSGFDKARAVEHVRDFQIPLHARPTELSGGQQAQVMLAIALGTQADVLLLDEPLASLDPLARSEFLARVRLAVRDRGATALLSSHIVSDMAQVCDRLVVLGRGRVLLDGSIDDAVSRHRTLPAESPLDPGVIEVGSFHDDASALRTLVRLKEPAAGDPADHAGDIPSLDEIVKGYLAAGRRVNGASGP